jgi:hypothetical protein
MNSHTTSIQLRLLSVTALLILGMSAGIARAEVKSGKVSGIGTVRPPNPFNIFSTCPPTTCLAQWDTLDDPASGSTDFHPIGIPLQFQFLTGQPLTYSCNQQEEYCMATYGQGGSFTMTGPLGTFTGVVTSGYANVYPLSWEIYVTFSGQWSSGLQMTGNADERYEDQNQIPDTQIDMVPVSGPGHPETH